MHKWQPVHTVGLLVLAAGVVGVYVGWDTALTVKGGMPVFTEKIIIFAPILAVAGLSMMVFPRLWAGPDGNTGYPRWGPVAGILALGLLIGLGSWAGLDALKRQWADARRTHRVCGEDVLQLTAELNGLLSTVRDQATAAEAEADLKRQAERGRELSKRIASLGEPTSEEREWLKKEFLPAVDAGIRKVGEAMPPAEYPEARRLTGEILKTLADCLAGLLEEEAPGKN
jgi:hypothetical protein